jgi:RNA polymerase sigma-70 factor (ECF subfamily)
VARQSMAASQKTVILDKGASTHEKNVRHQTARRTLSWVGVVALVRKMDSDHGAVVRPEVWEAAAGEALVRALRERRPDAATLLYDRYAPLIERVLLRVLGPDSELPDLLHEVFARALAGSVQLQDASALKSWLTQIAVFTARGAIRRRKRQRWLRFLPWEDLPEQEGEDANPEARAAVGETYAVLDKFPTEERLVFALRFIEGMEVAEIATACSLTIAQTKRRLSRAEQLFLRRARANVVLRDWVEEGTRWADR